MTSKKNVDEQIICLSALLLAVDAVEKLAKTGRCKTGVFNTLLPSLLRRNKNSAIEYYDDYATLDYGRETLLTMLNRESSPQVTYYGLQLIHVEGKLSKNNELMAILAQHLTQVNKQVAHFGLTHDNVLAGIAAAYSDTASKAANKIMISGEPSILNQYENVRKIRTLLMCGVRASSLWRASGGRRWQLIFARRQLAQRVAEISFT